MSVNRNFKRADAKLGAAQAELQECSTATDPFTRKRTRKEELAEALEAEKAHEALSESSATAITALASPLAGVFGPLAELIQQWNAHQGFWDPEGNDSIPEKIALMHSELSEALEAFRDQKIFSDKIPAFSGLEEELADTVIRILDFSGRYHLRLAEAIVVKLRYNLSRPYKHGKTC